MTFYEAHHFAYAKTKVQICFIVSVKLISAFVFATWIVQLPFFLNQKFQASSQVGNHKDRFSLAKAYQKLNVYLTHSWGTDTHQLMKMMN